MALRTSRWSHREIHSLIKTLAHPEVANENWSSHREIHSLIKTLAHPEVAPVNMLACAKAAWQIGDDQYKDGVKYLQVSTDEVYGSLGETGYFTETTPLDPHSPYSSSKASADLFVKAFGVGLCPYVSPLYWYYSTMPIAFQLKTENQKRRE